MRKALALGTLVALTVPVATVVACGNGQEGDDKSSASTKDSSGVYVQKHKDSEYPEMNQYLYDELNAFKPNDFAYQFYKLKGSDYFEQYKNKTAGKTFDNLYAIFEVEHNVWVTMFWHELYDWCHSLASNSFPYK